MRKWWSGKEYTYVQPDKLQSHCRHSYHLKDRKDSLHPCRVVPSRSKHRPGIECAPVFVGIGNGRVRFFDYFEGKPNSEKYSVFVHGSIAPALADLKAENGGSPVYLLRDGCPKSHATYAGREAERQCGVNTIEQPADTPEINTEDNSFWTLLDKEMEEHVKGWESAHPTLLFEETYDQFKDRARATAFALPEDALKACMGHTRKALRKIIEAKGWYIHG